MAHSFVSLKGVDVRVNDFDLIFFIFIFIRVAEKKKKDLLMNNMFSGWIDSVENDGAGNINMNLDEYLCSREMMVDFVDVFNDVKYEISMLPGEISSDFLNNLIKVKGLGFGVYKKGFLTKFVCDFDESLICLLK